MNAFDGVTYAVLVATALSVAGLCLEQLLNALHRPRRWAWCCTIALSVLLPLGAVLFPRTVVVPALHGVTPATSHTLAALARTAGLPPLTLDGPASSNPDVGPAPATQGNSMENVWRALLAGSLLLVPLLLTVQWMQLRLRQRRWRTSVLDASSVLVSDDFGPAVIGTLTPRIVVPSYVFALDATQQRLLMAHEREHVRAHDGRLSLAMILLVALAPWNLLLWWQYARLRIAIELDCDARVLDRGEPARAYGTLLLDMAGRMLDRPLFAPVVAEHFAGSLRKRIELITTRSLPVSRSRTFASLAIAVGAVTAIITLPRPAVSQPVRPAQTDSTTAIQVMNLNRSRQHAEAERVGTVQLGARTSLRGNGAACAVLIGVTFAQTLQEKPDAARASMQRFDRDCAQETFSDFFPGEADRVRRLVAGESVAAVYRGGGTPYVVTDSGATDNMMLNRAGRHAEAEQVGLAFLANSERALRKPEACAVLISVTYAQHVQKKTELAKASLQRFDNECADIAYQDWFPFESDRVRRLMNAGSR